MKPPKSGFVVTNPGRNKGDFGRLTKDRWMGCRENKGGCLGRETGIVRGSIVLRRVIEKTSFF